MGADLERLPRAEGRRDASERPPGPSRSGIARSAVKDEGALFTGTVKGLFLTHFLKLARQRLPPAEVEAMCKVAAIPPRVSSFTNYPIVPLLTFQELLAQRIFPRLELPLAMGRLGHEAFHAFAESASGRVATALVIHDVPRVASLIEQAYQSLADLGGLRTQLLSPTSFVIEFRDYLQYPQHQQGMLAEGCSHMRLALRPELNILSFRRSGAGRVIADFDIQMLHDPSYKD